MRPHQLLPLLCLFGCATAVTDPDTDAGTRDAAADSAAADTGTKPDGGAPDSGSSSCTTPFSGTLMTFDFTGELGTQSSTMPKSAAPGVTAGNISRAQPLMAVVGANSINATNWATSAQLDGTRYFTFSLTADPSCALDVSSITLDVKASGTGPTQAAIATSGDGFKQTSPFSANSAGPVAVSVVGASALEVRIYGYGASATTGTMRVQNVLTVTGVLR